MSNHTTTTTTTTDRIRFNVGGKIFETTATTLAGAGRHSMLGALLDKDWNPTVAGEFFIDRNPACFGVLLDLLRTGELHPSPQVPDRLLYREALYYGLLDHVRAARWGSPLDGNRLRHAAAITGTAPGDGTAVRAAPDGGCCVAHGSVVHLYNWMLDHRAPVTLDYQRVNDVGFLDPDHLVVTAVGKPPGGGGMGLFSSATGELKHRFQVSHQNEPKSFTAGALCFSDQNQKIFASCKGRCNEYGIGVWDQATGKQVDFFYESSSPGCSSLGDADKIQWLQGNNCLMVATLFPKTDNCYIGLLDFRAKNIVWSWSDTGGVDSIEEKRVLDAVAMEENRSICVVNQYDDLGFMDLRRSSDGGNGGSGGLRWSSRSRLMNKGKKMVDEELCYPKLAAHCGQLFSSMNDSISVFCGPEWVLTSRLRRSYGGSICDFSIGGDRLFALHSEENVFDVWETPPAPIV